MANLSDTAKEERARYMREYRKKNPDKTKEMNRRYWEKRAARKEENKDAKATHATE